MKKVLPLLALGAVVASASVQAKGNWYVGADVLTLILKLKDTLTALRRLAWVLQ